MFLSCIDKPSRQTLRGASHRLRLSIFYSNQVLCFFYILDNKNMHYVTPNPFVIKKYLNNYLEWIYDITICMARLPTHNFHAIQKRSSFPLRLLYYLAPLSFFL